MCWSRRKRMVICAAIGKIFSIEPCETWDLMLATPYRGYNTQLCLKNWQVQGSKFLHTWGCLVDFLSTQTQVRPNSSIAEQQCGNQEWIFPHPLSPKPSLQTNHPAQISKKSQRGILAVKSLGLQPAQIKKMVSRCRLPPPSFLLTLKSGDCSRL